ncbi:hypothetical protein Aduo_011919 [Ancylostoma duodenale]
MIIEQYHQSKDSLHLNDILNLAPSQKLRSAQAALETLAGVAIYLDQIGRLDINTLQRLNDHKDRKVMYEWMAPLVACYIDYLLRDGTVDMAEEIIVYEVIQHYVVSGILGALVLIY